MSYTSIDHEVFAAVQEQIETDTAVREVRLAPQPTPLPILPSPSTSANPLFGHQNIREALKNLDKEVKPLAAILARVHSIPPSEVPSLVTKARPHLDAAKTQLHSLIAVVKPYPYYKYNGTWTRDLQNLTFLVLLLTWLERTYKEGGAEDQGNALLKLEEAGDALRSTYCFGAHWVSWG